MKSAHVTYQPKIGVRLGVFVTACAVFLTFAPTLQAHSYTFLVKALRDYKNNPGPETKTALERAQKKAELYDDLAFWMLPGLILLYVIIRSIIPKKPKAG